MTTGDHLTQASAPRSAPRAQKADVTDAPIQKKTAPVILKTGTIWTLTDVHNKTWTSVRAEDGGGVQPSPDMNDSEVT